jgi:hypothetical protein
MPRDNRFRHQNYPTRPVTKPQFQHAVAYDGRKRRDFDRLHTDLGIRDIFIVHGTFMGDDPLGIVEILKSVSRSVPLLSRKINQLADEVKKRTRPLTNSVSEDIANYTPKFRDEFQKLIGDDVNVERMEPTWSSQNDHFARADLAVRLVCRLHEAQLADDERVLLWGHSHAGNGFAILSNLLANHRPSVESFFRLVEASAQGTDRFGEHWKTARQILASGPSPHPLAQQVYVAAFGTPVRYGWDTNGYRQLVHLQHHKQWDKNRPEITRPLFPPFSPHEAVTAKYGDWVQAFAIAGTDVPTLPGRNMHDALGRILEAGLANPRHGFDTRFVFPKKVRDACARWKAGTRCHTDGRSLLVDYAFTGRKTKLLLPIEQSVFGHGVATTIDFLPTHLGFIMDALIQEESA